MKYVAKYYPGLKKINAFKDKEFGRVQNKDKLRKSNRYAGVHRNQKMPFRIIKKEAMYTQTTQLTTYIRGATYI
jgi:hypothetical protein